MIYYLIFRRKDDSLTQKLDDQINPVIGLPVGEYKSYPHNNVTIKETYASVSQIVCRDWIYSQACRLPHIFIMFHNLFELPTKIRFSNNSFKLTK